MIKGLFKLALWTGVGLVTIRVLAGTEKGSAALTAAERLVFRQLVPDYAQVYLDPLFAVVDSEPEGSPAKSEFVLYAIGNMETKWSTGSGYTPKGSPAGTGDTGTRSANRWPPPGPPPGGRGWGHGLMQIDWGSHWEWLQTHDWTDPETNIRKGASILRDYYEFLGKPGAPFRVAGVTIGGPNGLPDPRPLSGAAQLFAALAAYNAGPYSVSLALARGLPADAYTYPAKQGREGYATQVLAMINDLKEKFS